MTSNRTPTSRSSSEEVGSSMMTSRASNETARAIATICWMAVLKVISGARTSASTSKRRSRSCASRFMRRQSIRPRRFGSRPRKMFSATER